MRGDRRGYFFVIDAIIASAVLFVGLFVLFGSSVQTQENLQPLATVDSLVQALATQPVSASVDPYYLSTLLPAGVVPYPDATPLEEVAYLWYANVSGVNTTGLAQNYTRSLLTTALGTQYGASLSINGTEVARLDHDAHYTYARQLVVYARLNDTAIVGPVPAEMDLWG